MAPAGVARPLPWGWPRPAPAAPGAPAVGARRGGRSRDDRMTPAPELRPRPRLMRSLAGVWKLASLTAPAGWGKTTVLAQWCSGRATLWVTATAAERDPAQLLGSFLASGSRLRPPLGRSTLARFSARREFERDGGLLTAAFLHELAGSPRPITLVVDDAHELSGARASIAWRAGLVERSHANVPLVFAPRGKSLWPAGRFARLGERHLDRSEEHTSELHSPYV